MERNHFIVNNYDSVTNIYTREKFEAEAEKLLNTHRKYNYMLTDTDIRDFKLINQKYGEEAANKVLSFFSTKIAYVADKFEGVCGRGFADHFYSIYRFSTPENAIKAFENVIYKMEEEFKNYEYPFRPKYGIVLHLGDGKKPPKHILQTMIANATLAKNTIKDNVTKSFAVFDNQMEAQFKKNQLLEACQEKALIDGEFFVMYQPKISLKTEKISGSEALVRWNKPGMGIISPDDFIPLFEKNGFVINIDFFVYETVLQFLDKRLKEGKPCVPISVNMSRTHSNPEEFVVRFLELFNKYDVPARYLQLEILERSYSDNKLLKEITDRLHQQGFTVAMDDFGSGSSSLNMLTKVPVDVLKFDRQFLLSATDENGAVKDKDAKFIQGLLEISNNLNKETIFEGVETTAQRDFLRAANCQHVQGYFYSKPLVEEDYVVFLENNL